MTRAHILIVEDERIVAKDIEHSLKAMGYRIAGIASTGKKAIEITREIHPELILMDIKLKNTMDGIEAAEMIRDIFDIPLVYLTANADDKALERAKLTGPFGYVMKPFNERELSSTIEMALYKHKMEKNLKESEERYRLLVEQSPDLIMVHSDGIINFINTAGARLLGVSSPNDLIGSPLFNFIHIDYHAFAMSQMTEIMEKGVKAPLSEEQYVRLNGELIDVEVESLPVTYQNKPAIQAVARDITERKRLEAQLLHAQKMEAVGTLANTIAHDFNNILTAIIGNGSFLQMKMEDNSPLRRYVDQILLSCDKAVNLTQGLLSFSRKRVIQAKAVRLNEIIHRIDRFLSSLIREEIELKFIFSERNLVVMADSGQMEQVLMNLVTNAKDAMPGGGSIIIRTGYIKLGNDFEGIHGYGKAGEYAHISVSDSGHGMDKATMEKIFEPFFTTKEFGKGTGLGMAIVYGIVKQHNGYINIFSEPGKGAVFNIYLPLIESEAGEEELAVRDVLKGGNETILIAEDDELARNLIKEILERYGYNVMIAVDGEDALNTFKDHKDEISLILFDVIMPRKSGPAAYEEMKRINPAVKALFMSGYTPEIIGENGLFEKDIIFIQKPIIPYLLLKSTREALDSD
ncbi:MAG: hybrid sensor histidine kinase/response regulator [Syntrophus sp. (in: bacteria)]|nr:hybrid sensor histidine kinase/response regulator [Syntrophus sp. (in: bacteria)]